MQSLPQSSPVRTVLYPGSSRPKKYTAWSNIKRRVRPGEFGMCSEWLNDYAAFARDVPNPEREDLVLSLIDNTRGYEPGNVEWCSNLQSVRNNRNRKEIEYLGRSQTLAEWCRELHLNYPKIKGRLSRGWSNVEALSQPRDCRLPIEQPFDELMSPLRNWASRWIKRQSSGKAQNRGKSFDKIGLTVDYLVGLWVDQQGKCALSGRNMVLNSASVDGTYLYEPANISIDRIDSSLGYRVGNLQLVCLAVNTVKSAMSQSDFIGWCRDIAEFSVPNTDSIL